MDVRALREAFADIEARYRAVFQFSDDPIYFADLDTQEVLECNCAFLDLLGLSDRGLPEDFRVGDFVAHESASVDRVFELLRDGGRVAVGERKWRRQDGSVATVEVNASVVPFKGRQCCCIVAHDVSVRAKAEEELRRRNRRLALGRRIDRLVAVNLGVTELAKSLAHALQPLGRFSRVILFAFGDGRISEVLAAWPEDDAGCDCRAALDDAKAASALSDGRIIQSGSPGERRIQVPLTVDGAVFAVLCLGSAALRPYRAHTEALLESVSPEIAIAVTRSLASRSREEIARVKAEFVAIASHELRTPLSVIKGYARMLLAPGFATDEAERRGYLERLYDGCDRMTRLVDDLLDAARIEEGKIPLRSDKIHVGRVLAQLAPALAERYGSAPRLPAGERVVEADPVAVERILHNLLDNAYKYSEGGTVPEVRWRQPSRAARRAVEVVNDGAAFSPEELGRLFQRFGRLPRHSARPGTGLGLYAARTLVEQMGGDMGVESAKGRVAFWFELPAVRLGTKRAGASTSTS